MVRTVNEDFDTLRSEALSRAARIMAEGEAYRTGRATQKSHTRVHPKWGPRVAGITAIYVGYDVGYAYREKREWMS
jgi:hypothetical protein